MGTYDQGADFYDLLYSEKDYGAESEIVANAIRSVTPGARSILDVGCGTGKHARALTDLGFAVDGIDVEPRFAEIAAARCPEGTFSVGDMTTFNVGRRYDAVVCLFSAIGYVRNLAGLSAAISHFVNHLNPGGCVIVDPWFAPGELSDGWISTVSGENGMTRVVRMSRTVLNGAISRLEFEYLIGTASGIERKSEVHELGLFSQAEMEASFKTQGLSVKREKDAPRTRGIYLGTLRSESERGGPSA